MPMMLAKVIYEVKVGIGLASGVRIVVTKDNGEVAHGRIIIQPHGIKELLKDCGLSDMRVGTFCQRFSVCIGAQIGAKISLEFAGQAVDGRRALKSLT